MDNSIVYSMIKESKNNIKMDTNSLANIDEQISDLDIKINEMNGRLDFILSKLKERLEVKKTEFETSTGHICEIGYDSTSDEIHTWYIEDTKVTPPDIEPPSGEEPERIYEYEGVGWDNDTLLTQYINDYDWIYDLLNHDISMTGTYGLIPTRDLLINGKNATQSNLNKNADMQDVFLRNTILT